MGGRAYSLYDIEQFIREAGAERVTEEAVLNLERELERLTEAIADKAVRYAQHAGRRKLIRRSDVMLANAHYRRPYILIKKASATNAISMIER